MDEKLKSENMQKEQFSEWGWGRCRERRYAYHTFIQIYLRMHHFVQIFKIFFVSGGKEALTPLNEILRTPLQLQTLCNEHVV